MALLKKKKDYRSEQLEAIHAKAKLTLQVLNENMIIGDIPLESIFQLYKEITLENAILLTMRCKILYDARVQVRRILTLLIQHGEVAELYKPLLGKKARLNEAEMMLLRQSMRLLQRLESALSLFKEDHKIFKGKFLYSGKDQYLEVPRLQNAISSTLRNAVPEDSLDTEDSRVLMAADSEPTFRSVAVASINPTPHVMMQETRQSVEPEEEVKTPVAVNRQLEAYLEYNKLVEEDFP